MELTLILPGTRPYPARSTPDSASPPVDARNGKVRVWAYFDNPDGLLRPGMAITVHSDIGGVTP